MTWWTNIRNNATDYVRNSTAIEYIRNNGIVSSAMYMYGKIRGYLQPHIYIDSTYDEIIRDFLYISDLPSACNYEAMRDLGITHIICIIQGVDPIFPECFVYHNIHIDDKPKANIIDYFDECCDFIDNARRENGKVLVHCMCGVSRSATIVCSYLMKHNKMTTHEALLYLKCQRSCVQPNTGFLRQLDEWYNQIQESHVSQSQVSQVSQVPNDVIVSQVSDMVDV